MAPNGQKGEGLDAAKVNGLLANVDSRLMGGLHGEFYEEGSKLGDGHRHEQLATLFELKEQLTTIQSEMQKKVQHAVDEEDKNSKGAGKANGNMIKTIKSIVEQEMADKLRTLSIENERLRERAKKAEEMSEMHAAKIKTLEQKIKKVWPDDKGQSTGGGSLGLRVATLESRMVMMNEREEALESGAAQRAWNLDDRVRDLEHRDATASMKAAETARKGRSEYQSHAARLHKLEANDIDKETRLEEINIWKEGHIQDYEHLRQWTR